MKTIVAFHIGRGGHYQNHGHKTFMPYVHKLQDCIDYSKHTIISEDEDGNKLPDDKWLLVDGGDNVILEGREEIECKTGILDWDGEYDTDIVKYIEDCNQDEIKLLVEAFANDYISKDYLPEIVSMWGDTFDLEAKNGEYYIDICYNKKKVFAYAFDEPCVLKLGNVAIWDSSNDSREDLEHLFSLY